MNYYNDNDRDNCSWLRELIAQKLIPDGEVDERSIVDVQPNEIRNFEQCHFFAGVGGWSQALQLAGWPASRKVWTGSCPCQPFSTCGRQMAESDERHLWPAFRELIAKCRPSAVFGEQVASKIARRWMSNVRFDLEGIGYAIGIADLCAASVSSPQNRPRFYWFAHNHSDRQSKSGEHLQNPGNYSTACFREADRLVDAIRRNALPFLCSGHDGLPARVGQVAVKGFGNAITPPLAAQFIGACLEALDAMKQN